MKFDHLETESRNLDTFNLDILTTQEIVSVIHREDEKVTAAVQNVLPDIAAAVDLIVESILAGGRLFYIGAGTSGRLGVLDAVECPPTFGISPEMIQGILAGGEEAMFHAIEGAEDDPILAKMDLETKNLSSHDIVVGLSASGRTPYVLGGLRYAAVIGCPTIAVVCVSEAELCQVADLTIVLAVGPEVIAGSTRMKAGTAQKMVLNILSTTTMVKLNKTFGNLMVDVKASNEKLNARVCRIVREATGASEQEAANALSHAAGSAKAAIVILLTGVTPQIAFQCIETAHGSVRNALPIAEREKQSNDSASSHNG